MWRVQPGSKRSTEELEHLQKPKAAMPTGRYGSETANKRKEKK
jgi:hypothetical protein